MTLSEFLLARIGEDEARYSADPSEYGYGHAFRLAECEAKRRIVAEHSPTDPCDAHNAAYETIPCDTLGHLAGPYADHPDYRDEWRP